MADSRGRFVWYELMTTDLAAAKAFYAEVIGWQVRDAPIAGLAYSLFTVADGSAAGAIGLPAAAQNAGAKPRWLGYIAVDDVDAAASRIVKLGGVVHVPPTDVPNISRFALVADPQAATFAVIKGLQPAPQQPLMPDAPGRVGWHELIAADWQAALPFYGGLFDWQKAEAHAGSMGIYQQFSVGGQTFGGIRTKPAEVSVPFWLYYFNVGDIEAATARVKKAGGEVLEGPREAADGSWTVRCADPQGASFALAGTRGRKVIGYFEGTAPRDPSGAQRRRWSW